MKTFQDVYKRNKQLDDIFFSKYESENSMYEKNCIEFLVEFGEFLNETKCFKYWSIKKPQRDKVLEELADVFTMLLYFYNVANLDIDDIDVVSTNSDALELINETYSLGTELYKKLSKELLDKIFMNLLTIAKNLDIDEKDIIEAIDKKHHIIEERLNNENY